MKKLIQFLFVFAISLSFSQYTQAQDAVTTDDSFSSDSGASSPDTTIESMAPVGDEAAPAKTSTNQVYAIRQGDTMWDICKIVLDNPWYWPKLWSLNQYVLNPNLIYPGNQLVFSPATDTTFPRMEVVKGEQDVSDNQDSIVDQSEAENTRTTTEKVSHDSSFIVEESKLRQGESLGIKLRPIVFVSKKGLKTIGEVSNSIELKTNLSFGDQLYLTFFKKNEVKVGDRFQVIEKIKMVFDPDRETKKIGWLIKKKAVVTVNHIIEDKKWKKRVVEAVYSDGDDPILRGDELVPFETNVRNVTPHFTDKNIFGKIVEADAQQILISNNDFVFLNIGANEGLQPGLQLYVVRRGDGLEEFVNDGLPDYPVARIMIVEAFPTTATAYVTTLDQPLAVGDRVRSKVE